MVLALTFDDGSTANFVSSTSWLATTAANPIRYSHLFHGEVYDANLENPADEAFGQAVVYNTTDRSQTGVPEVPTLHTMPPITPVNKSMPAISVTKQTSTAGFLGRFIKGSGKDIFWQSNDTADGSKHFVPFCEMYGAHAACS